MWYCPICGKEHMQGLVCDHCGFDQSCNYEQYGTLCFVLPGGAEPISVLEEKWVQQQKQMVALVKGALVCPECGGESFSFLINEMQFVCTDCGWKKSAIPPKDGSVSEEDTSVGQEAAGVSVDTPLQKQLRSRNRLRRPRNQPSHQSRRQGWNRR